MLLEKLSLWRKVWIRRFASCFWFFGLCGLIWNAFMNFLFSCEIKCVNSDLKQVFINLKVMHFSPSLSRSFLSLHIRLGTYFKCVLLCFCRFSMLGIISMEKFCAAKKFLVYKQVGPHLLVRGRCIQQKHKIIFPRLSS